MYISINGWVRSIKEHINIKTKEKPQIKRFCKFSDKYIREKIYDYLEENIFHGIDGYDKIIINSYMTGESVALDVLDSNGDMLICEKEGVTNKDVFFTSEFHFNYAGDTNKILSLDISTLLQYKISRGRKTVVKYTKPEEVA